MPGFEKLWFNKVAVMREDADTIVGGALHLAGWKHTSQTPGSVWMWEKQINGCTYRVPQEFAASIQEHFDRDSYFESFPEEMDD